MRVVKTGNWSVGMMVERMAAYLVGTMVLTTDDWMVEKMEATMAETMVSLLVERMEL